MPAASPASQTFPRAQLLALAAGNDSYAFLRTALPLMPELAADTQLCLQVVRHYLLLGLVGPALEVATKAPPGLKEQLDRDEVVRRLLTAPSGRVPWTMFEARFQANLAVIAQRFPELWAASAAWREARDGLDLYQCRDGNYQIATTNDLGQRVWLPDLRDHKDESERVQIPPHPVDVMAMPYLFEGLGLGWLFERIVRTVRNTCHNYSPAMYVIEPNLAALAAVLHLHDWRDLLGEPRIFVFAGPNWSERLGRTLLDEPELSPPRQYVRCPVWGAPITPPAETVIADVNRIRDEERARLKAEVASTYCGGDLHFWARRFSEANGDDPLRVMFLVSRHTTYLKYCIRDLASAFERRGIRTLTLTETADHTTTSTIRVLREIQAFRPDMFFVIDHFRREHATFMPPNVPYVGWIQDQLLNLYCREAGQSLGPFDFFIARDIDSLARGFGYPASQGLTWTAAADDRQYSSKRMPARELAPHRCDVSFVSHQSKTPCAFLAEQIAAFSADRQTSQYMECLYALLLRDFAQDPRTGCSRPARLLLEEASQETGLSVEDDGNADRLVRFFLHQLAEFIFRQGTLEWVADYCDRTGRILHIYGSGWDRHPRFARYARGAAANGTQLRSICQASRVNLQICGGGGIHQRLLDGLLAGGFFLVRYSPFDVMHDAIRGVLAAIEKYAAQPDTDYPADQVPELADGLRTLAVLEGDRVPGQPIRFPSAHLAQYREHAAQGYGRIAGAVFQQYPQVSFASPAEFAALADRFLCDDAARANITAGMRAVVADRYTYGSLVHDLLAFMRRRLKECAATQPSGPAQPA